MDDIKKQYRKLSRIYHPDRHVTAEHQEYALKKFPIIDFAKTVLSDPVLRKTYDRWGYNGLGIALQIDQDNTDEDRELLESKLEKVIPQYMPDSSSFSADYKLSLDGSELRKDLSSITLEGCNATHTLRVTCFFLVFLQNSLLVLTWGLVRKILVKTVCCLWEEQCNPMCNKMYIMLEVLYNILLRLLPQFGTLYVIFQRFLVIQKMIDSHSSHVSRE